MSDMIWGESTFVSDFAPECPCGDPGTIYVQSHPVGECGGAWDLMEGVWLCGPCFKDDLERTQAMLFSIFLGLMEDHCECGRDLSGLAEVYERVQPMWAWPDE